MKIFYIDPQSYSNLALYDYNLLSNIDNDITFIGSFLYDQPLPSNVKLFQYFTYNNKKGAFKILSYLISLFRVTLKIIKEKPNVIHIQWIKIYLVDYLFLIFMLKFNCKVVYTAHNTLPHDDLDEKTFGIFKKYYENVSEIIVHTESTKKELVNKFGITASKINIIPHGLLDQACDNDIVEQKIQDFKQLYNLNGKMILACLGAQSYYKGFDFIERLWKEISDFNKNEDIHLIVAGRATKDIDYNAIEGFDNVTTLNYFLSKEEFEAVIRLSDIILLPYRNISQSGVLLSVLAKNKPVLVSNMGGLTDPFKCGEVGWIIGEPTYDNFKTAMLEILDSPGKLRLIANNSEIWDKINDMFSWERIGETTLCLYRKTVYC